MLLALRGYAGKSHPSPNPLARLEKSDMLQVEQSLLASGLHHQMGKTAHWDPRDGVRGRPWCAYLGWDPRLPKNLRLIH